MNYNVETGKTLLNNNNLRKEILSNIQDKSLHVLQIVKEES
jgi:hypothetical protein